MNGCTKEWKQLLRKLKKRHPGLRFETAKCGHLRVTCDGRPGKLLVSISTKNTRTMQRDEKRIVRHFELAS